MYCQEEKRLKRVAALSGFTPIGPLVACEETMKVGVFGRNAV